MIVDFPTDEHERKFKHLLTRQTVLAKEGETAAGHRCLYVRPQNADHFANMLAVNGLKDCPASNAVAAFLRTHPGEWLQFIWHDENLAMGASAGTGLCR